MKIKKFLALSTAMAVALSTSQTVFAQETPDNSESEYLEYHYQVNFDDLDVFVVGGKTLDIASNGGRSMDAETMEAVDALLSSLAECSEVEDEIVDMLNDNQQLAAVSFTEAPLIFNEDHFDRVRTADAEFYYKDNDEDGKRGEHGKFTLFTSVFRASSVDANGKYQYTTVTYGAWSENSIWGGENYPDSGVDYVLQSIPNTWERTDEDWMTARYDNTPYDGDPQKDFWPTEGGEHYIKYAIKDDPYEFAKARQNTSFSMACISKGDASTSTRKINSYYIHTWDEINISVSISVNTKREVTLSITPSLAAYSWQLYNDLDFNF